MSHCFDECDEGGSRTTVVCDINMGGKERAVWCSYKRKNRYASHVLCFVIGLRQAKVVEGDPCGINNDFTSNRIID